MAIKKTQVEMFDKIIEVCSAYPEIVEFCEGRKALIAKKKNTPNQANVKLNGDLTEIVLQELQALNSEVTVSELMASPSIKNFDGATITSSRITYVLRQLVDSKQVVNTKKGKKSLYSIA